MNKSMDIAINEEDIHIKLTNRTFIITKITQKAKEFWNWKKLPELILLNQIYQN